MSLSATEITRLVNAGIDAKQLALIAEMIEERTSIIEVKKEKERDRKRKQRELSRDSHGTVTGQNTDSHGTPPSDGSNGFSPHPSSLTSLTPPKERTPKGVPKKAPSMVQIPDWIPKGVWEGFVEMRQKIKKPMTERAMQLAINKLDVFRAKGHDPTEILNQSILNDYQDLYEPKEKSNATRRHENQSQPAKSQIQRAVEATERARAARELRSTSETG